MNKSSEQLPTPSKIQQYYDTARSLYTALFLHLLILTVLSMTPEARAQAPGSVEISTCLYPQTFELSTSPQARSYVSFYTFETWWKQAVITVNQSGTAVITYGVGSSNEPTKTITFAAGVPKVIPASLNNAAPILEIELLTQPNTTIEVTVTQQEGVSECIDVGNPDPTATATLTVTPTPSDTPELTVTPTATPDNTVTPTTTKPPQITVTATETNTPVAVPTATATFVPTKVTPEHTVTVTGTPTDAVVVTVTPTATAAGPTKTPDTSEQVYLPFVTK